MTIPTRIGIDIGRVIIADDTDNTVSFFSRDFLQARPVADAFETITRITARYDAQNVFLVSKCGSATAQRSLLWLHHHDFFERTGIQPEQVHFCEQRFEKKFICESLDIDIFIDDRYTVMEHLEHLRERYLFDPNNGERQKFEKLKRRLRHIWLVETWQELAEKMGL